MPEATPQSVLFSDLFGKPTVGVFDAEALSSDGGGALLRAVDRRLGLTKRLSSCLSDRRAAGRVQHRVEELFTQRVHSIALGYEDQNDAARLARDSVMKGLVGRGPVRGADLASQSTRSRFENAASARELVTMMREVEDFAVERLKKRRPHARRVTLDLDATCDPTHGHQQGTFFNAFYGTWCYLPLVGVLSVPGDRDQHLFAARLRRGTTPATHCLIPTIRRMVRKLRAAFPGVKVRVRLDGGFGSPRLLDVLDELAVEYVVGLPKNVKLLALCELELTAAMVAATRDGASVRFYGEAPYRAGTWSRERRVVFKAEVLVAEGKVDKDNPRFVVTNVPVRVRAQTVYEDVYCRRGVSVRPTPPCPRAPFAEHVPLDGRTRDGEATLGCGADAGARVGVRAERDVARGVRGSGEGARIDAVVVAGATARGVRDDTLRPGARGGLRAYRRCAARVRRGDGARGARGARRARRDRRR